MKMIVMDYAKILADKETPAFMRDLVHVVQEKGGTTVGNWLREISTFDLMAVALVTGNLAYGKTPLKETAENPLSAGFGDYPISVLKSVAVLIDVLSAAEGLDITRDTKIAIKRMFLLEKYVGYEILKRRGLNFKVSYENMSLNEDIESPDAHATVITPGENLVDQLEEMVQGLDSALNRIEKEVADNSHKPIESQDPSVKASLKVYRYNEDGTREAVPMQDLPANIRESILKSFADSGLKDGLQAREVAVHMDDTEDQAKQEDPPQGALGLRNKIVNKVYDALVGVLNWVGKFRKAKIQGKMES